jgi:hypothetical protein
MDCKEMIIAHTEKRVARMLRRRIERKIKKVLAEDQFGFRRTEGNREAIGILRIMPERTLDIDEELCVYLTHWPKASDRVNRTKSMQILKELGWRERRLISKLYMDHSVKLRLDQGETRSVKTGRGVRQGCCLSQILFNLYSAQLNKEALEGFGDFQIGGHIIHTVKYGYDLVLLAKEGRVPQGVSDKII